MIYFVRQGDSIMVKVGYTENKASLKQRIKALQTCSPFKLHLIRTMDGNVIAEQRLHDKLAVHHVRGEWYALSKKEINSTTNLSFDDIDNNVSDVWWLLETLFIKELASSLDVRIHQPCENLGRQRSKEVERVAPSAYGY